VAFEHSNPFKCSPGWIQLEKSGLVHFQHDSASQKSGLVNYWQAEIDVGPAE